MPTKINLTRNDELVSMFREVSLKPEASITSGDAIRIAEAVLISSFSSAHSWQTYKCIISKNPNSLRSPIVKEEYVQAEKWKWKKVRSTDINEVAQIEMPEMLFSAWLNFNAVKEKKTIYREAWCKLRQELNTECDGHINMVSSRL
jgi:hypothetical protein